MNISHSAAQPRDASSDPLPYTTAPRRLVWADTKLFFRWFTYIPWVVIPIKAGADGELDEFYRSKANMRCIGLHAVLLVLQLLFLLSLPLAMLLSAWVFTAWVVGILALNWWVLKPLNGPKTTLESKVDLSGWPEHESEKWIYVNGIVAGHHWLQTNIDRLALTFRRPILGIHNPTTGLIFDILQCLIQRDFRYATADIRTIYATVKPLLLSPSLHKVVLILHSQGGIEGGMVIDWLLADLPDHATAKFEVYTFGNAANHFNSPLLIPPTHRATVDGTTQTSVTKRTLANGAIEPVPRLDTLTPSPHSPTVAPTNPPLRIIRHIEHYAQTADFVARWGVLAFATTSLHHVSNRYVGEVFTRETSGHLFNQHYMAGWFPMDGTGRVVDGGEGGGGGRGSGGGGCGGIGMEGWWWIDGG